MEILSEIVVKGKRGALREFMSWIIERQDILICTVHIEYFKKGGNEADPIVFKFGHKGVLDAK